MRIHELELSDRDSDWNLAPTEFFPDLTLLVGITGVGKTRILRAVSMLRDIAEASAHHTFWGISWKVRFSTDDGGEYVWSGAFEQRDSQNGAGDGEDDLARYFRSPERKLPRPKIVKESLAKDGKVIVERDAADIRLNGDPTPKLSPYESVLKILSEEAAIAPAHQAFQQVLSVNHHLSDSGGSSLVSDLDELGEEFDTLEKMRNSNLSTKIKLGLVHRNDPGTFELIVERFMSVFPQVIEVDVQNTRAGSRSGMLQIRIKERGVSKWIPEYKISSGMARTLMHLSRMALWPDGMVVLIDEFENSLGVNCIDFITDDLVYESRRLQFIITSHHPYIIDNIDTRCWKIVVRDGSTVSTRDFTQLDPGVSRHKAFLRLINLLDYREGIQEGIAVE